MPRAATVRLDHLTGQRFLALVLPSPSSRNPTGGAMELPPQQEFTLENVAHSLKTSVAHVEEMVSTGVFKHIIVKGENIRHFYFDQDLFRERRPKLPDLRKEDKDRKEAQIRWLLAKNPDRTPDKEYEREAARRIDRIRKNIPEDDTFYRIGPNEVALLWQPSQPSEKWTRPIEGIIYIPRLALEAFEQEHGHQNESNAEKAKKKDTNPALDPSMIRPDRWYGPASVARALQLDEKYVRNHIDAIIRSRQLTAKREGVHPKVTGKSLRDAMERNDAES
jgi:hypothetical protein